MASADEPQGEAVTEFLPAEMDSSEKVGQQWVCFTHNRLLKKMIDAVPNVVMVLNDKRQLVFCNKPFLELADVDSAEDVLGLRPGDLLRCIHAESSALGCGSTRFCRTCGAARAIQTSLGGKRNEQECRITVIRRSENGGYETDALDLLVSAAPLNVDGEIYTIFHIQDISDRKRRRALERIFFHDVINTAGAIRGFIELVDSDSMGEDGEYLSIVKEQTDRLVRDILAQKQLQEAENGELEVCAGSVDCLDLLRSLAVMYTRHPIGEGRTIALDEKCEPLVFSSDVALVSRVLENMIKNALEATPLGGVVGIGCRHCNDQIEFYVYNPGVIPENTQLQMFKRSFSTKGAGRGLGTYSMQLLASKYLKGQIRFKSTPETGTFFYFSLPKS